MKTQITPSLYNEITNVAAKLHFNTHKKMLHEDFLKYINTVVEVDGKNERGGTFQSTSMVGIRIEEAFNLSVEDSNNVSDNDVPYGIYKEIVKVASKLIFTTKKSMSISDLSNYLNYVCDEPELSEGQVEEYVRGVRAIIQNSFKANTD